MAGNHQGTWFFSTLPPSFLSTRIHKRSPGVHDFDCQLLGSTIHDPLSPRHCMDLQRSQSSLLKRPVMHCTPRVGCPNARVERLTLPRRDPSRPWKPARCAWHLPGQRLGCAVLVERVQSGHISYIWFLPLAVIGIGSFGKSQI